MHYGWAATAPDPRQGPRAPATQAHHRLVQVQLEIAIRASDIHPHRMRVWPRLLPSADLYKLSACERFPSPKTADAHRPTIAKLRDLKKLPP